MLLGVRRHCNLDLELSEHLRHVDRMWSVRLLHSGRRERDLDLEWAEHLRHVDRLRQGRLLQPLHCEQHLGLELPEHLRHLDGYVQPLRRERDAAQCVLPSVWRKRREHVELSEHLRLTPLRPLGLR